MLAVLMGVNGCVLIDVGGANGAGVNTVVSDYVLMGAGGYVLMGVSGYVLMGAAGYVLMGASGYVLMGADGYVLIGLVLLTGIS